MSCVCKIFTKDQPLQMIFHKLFHKPIIVEWQGKQYKLCNGCEGKEVWKLYKKGKYIRATLIALELVKRREGANE